MSTIRINKLEDLAGNNGILVSDINKSIDGGLRILKPALTFPTVRDNGSPLEIGDSITNLADGFEYKYTGSGWLSTDIARLNMPDGSASIGFINEENSLFVEINLSEKIKMLPIDVKEFGASETFDDNRKFLQNAIDFCAKNNRKLVSFGNYSIKGPLYIPSFLDWSGGGTIKNTYSGSTSQLRLCLYPGTFNPVYYISLNYKESNNIVAGSTSLTLKNSLDSSTFKLGDLVFIRTTSFYNGASGIIPTFGTLNRISSIDSTTGKISFEYPIVESVSSPLIAKTDDTGIKDIINERDIFCTYKSSIKGISFESVNGHIMERGGMLGCSFYFPRMKSLSGLYTNLMCNSRVVVDEIICDLRAIEVAGNSNTMSINVGTISYTKTSRSNPQAIISVNENQVNCSILVEQLSADSYDYSAQPLIHFLSSRSNTVYVKRLQALYASGSLVTFENLLKNGSGETQSETSNNSCTIELAISGTNLQRNGYWIDSGGQNRRNKLIGSFATTPSQTAISLAGASHNIDCIFSSGNISLSTSINSNIKVETTGMVTGYTRGSFNNVTLNGQLLESRPKINSVIPCVNLRQDGNSGAVTYTPNFLLGTTQHNSFISATSYTIANPTGGVAGDRVCIVITNNNATTAITPTFGSAYSIAGNTIAAIPVGKRAIFNFEIMQDFAYILMGYANNV